MPSTRRTRAMGHSPGGPKALDINASTRHPRKAKVAAAPKDASAPATRATRARPGSKRKNEDATTDQPPAKKYRVTKSPGLSVVIASGSQSLTTLPDLESEPLLEGTSSSQEEDPARGIELTHEPRVNMQQPTPPLDTPVETNIVPHITKPPPAKEQENASLTKAQSQLNKKRKNDKRISDVIRHYSTMIHDEEEDEEKALSECDDDEWAKRYPSVMEAARNPTPFISSPKTSSSRISTSKSEWEKWVPGSTAMFVVRDSKQKETATRSKDGPCMPPMTSTSGSFTTISCLAKLGPKSLTDIDTIVAISTSLDWYEKNPSIAVPSAAEVTTMLDNYARAKSAQQSEVKDDVATQDSRFVSLDAPNTPKALITTKEFPEAPRPSESDVAHSNTDGQNEQGLEHSEEDSANIMQDIVELVEPQTPQQLHGSPGPRTWSSALSASGIGNIILTPLNKWFSRSERNRQNVASTERRRTEPRHRITRVAESKPKPLFQSKPAHSSKTPPAKSISSQLAKSDPTTPAKCSPKPNLGPILAPESSTPTASQPRRGRPDSHLPVHLRGVQFEDLPPEWQAVSEHLRKPQQPHEEEQDSSPIDTEFLQATARRSRREREREELKAQAELIAQKQRDLDSDNDCAVDPVDVKVKKRVTFSARKIYSAKLGHSTFGMPENIDDDSSEEDVEILGPRTHFGRNSRPMKSCLKRSYQKPMSEDHNEEIHGEDGNESRPSKKARIDDLTSSQNPGILETTNDGTWRGEACESFLYDDDPYRARPFTHFISIPPSQLRRAEAAQLEYERLNPRNRSRRSNSPSKRKSHGHGDKDHDSRLSTTGDSNPADGWHNLFRTRSPRSANLLPVEELARLKTAASRRKLYGTAARDENGRIIRNPGALEEASEARLNKQREDAMKHKPKTSSSLQVGRTLSPIKGNLSSKNIEFDVEVLKAIALLKDDEILEENFGKCPEHVEDTVSREASKAEEYLKRYERGVKARSTRKDWDSEDEAEEAAEAVEAAEAMEPAPIDFTTCLDNAAQAIVTRNEGEGTKAAEAAKSAGYTTWFDRQYEAREARLAAEKAAAEEEL